MATLGAGYCSAALSVEREQRQDFHRSSSRAASRPDSRRPNPLLTKQPAINSLLLGSGLPRAPLPNSPRAARGQEVARPQQQQQQQQQQQRQHSRAESSAKSRSPGGAEGPELSEPALNSNFRYAARQLSEAQSAQQSSDQVPQVRTISRSSGERQGLVRSRSETLPVGLEDNHRHPPSDYLPPSKNQEGIDSILHKANVETDVVYIDKGSQVIWRALNEELLQLGQRCELAETHLRQRTKDLLAVQLELEHTNAENADLRVQLHTVQKQRHGAYAKIHADRDALDQRCKKAETDLAHRASELLILKKELVHSSAVRSSLCAELEALKEHGQCVICLSEAATHVVVPCGHQALCRACATQDMQSCPVCRQPVHALIRVYRP